VTDEGARIRSYLQAQAAKLAPAAIVANVREATAKLERAALAVPDFRFRERPAPEEWSADEVLAHVVDAGRHFGDQVLAILDARPPAATARERPGPEPRTASAWMIVLRQDREVLFERVLRADPQTRLDATIEHRMFGPLNWREILLFTRLHDLDHAGQIEKIVTLFTVPRPV
jgi:uncharacterized damage-inducible protein DinB